MIEPSEIISNQMQVLTARTSYYNNPFFIGQFGKQFCRSCVATFTREYNAFLRTDVPGDFASLPSLQLSVVFSEILFSFSAFSESI